MWGQDQRPLARGLKSEGKRVYIELTKAAGELMQETQPTPPNKNSEETPPQQKEQVATVSTGRERFGNTKYMASFPLDVPILVEFKK